MDVRIKLSGLLDKKLKKHRKLFFPHIGSWSSYFAEIARQKADEDFKGEKIEEDQKIRNS